MIKQLAEQRTEYRTPITVWAQQDYESLIAQSSLENVTEGEEWKWEE